jgi:hypothetical protein
MREACSKNETPVTDTFCDWCDHAKSRHGSFDQWCDEEDCPCEEFVEADPPLVKCRG